MGAPIMHGSRKNTDAHKSALFSLDLLIDAAEKQSRNCKLPNMNAREHGKSSIEKKLDIPDPFSELFSSSFNNARRSGKEDAKQGGCVCGHEEPLTTGIPDAFGNRLPLFGEEHQLLTPVSRDCGLDSLIDIDSPMEFLDNAKPTSSPCIFLERTVNQHQSRERYQSLTLNNKGVHENRRNSMDSRCNQEFSREDIICTPKSLENESVVGAEHFGQLRKSRDETCLYSGFLVSRGRREIPSTEDSPTIPRKEGNDNLLAMGEPKNREDFDKFIDLFLRPSVDSSDELLVDRTKRCVSTSRLLHTPVRLEGGQSVKSTNSHPYQWLSQTGPVVHAMRRKHHIADQFCTQQSPQRVFPSLPHITMVQKKRGRKPKQVPGTCDGAVLKRHHFRQVFTSHPHLLPVGQYGYASTGYSPFANRISDTCAANRSPAFAKQSGHSTYLPLMGNCILDNKMDIYNSSKSLPTKGSIVSEDILANKLLCKSTGPIHPASCFLIRIKLFRPSRMTEIQKAKILELVGDRNNFRFKFYRTVSEVAGIFDLPKLRFRQYDKLRTLHGLFSRCGGLLSSDVRFLNTHKALLSRCYHMYLSYILPLETCDVFCNRTTPSGKKNRSSKVDRQDLVLCLSTGIHDDVLFLFEEMERVTISDDLASSILELFFQVSETLFGRLGHEVPSLQRLKHKFESKAYNRAIEKMPVKLLDDLQEAAFNALLRYKRTKRASVKSNKGVVVVVDILLAKRALSLLPRKDTWPIDTAGSSMACTDALDRKVLEFVIAANVPICCTDAVMDVLECGAQHSPEMALRASRMVLMDEERRRSLFFVLRGHIEDGLCRHLETMENKTLLNDNGEFETIVNLYLRYLLASGSHEGNRLLNRMACTVESYQEHLRLSRVYFHKRNSSNIETVAETLDLMCEESL